MMRRIEIPFLLDCTPSVFPKSPAQLPQALVELNLASSYPVIVLIGGFIQDKFARATQKAIETVAAFAEENSALIICGGSDLGVMASIGRTRAAHRYTFPLLGINLEKLVTWPGGPQVKGFLWWREDKVSLAPGYSHFILVPGKQYGDDSPWIAEAATLLSKGSRSVTVLANGGSISRKDIALSLEKKRSVIVLEGTGRLADEMANQPDRPALVTAVPAEDEDRLRKTMLSAISIYKENSNDSTNKGRTND